MKKYETRELRNVGLVGHGQCGKTSLGEALLFNAKATTRLGSVDSETSTFDWEPEEIRRKSSVSVSIASAEHKRCKINVLDTPGDSNFLADTRYAMQAMDAAVLVISAVDGVQVVTEKVWGLLQQAEMPRLFFINRMDRERSNWRAAVEDLRESLGVTPLLLQYPIGTESAFRGVVDLLRRKALLFAQDGSGKFTEEDVPADLADEVEEARRALVEGIAETNEALMDKYFEEEDLPLEDIKVAFPKAFAAGELFPVMFGAATTNIGVTPLLDFLADICPSPDLTGSVKGSNPDTKEPVERPINSDAPFSALVFKTVADPYAGKLTVFKIMSGVLTPDSTVLNSSLDVKERYGALLAINGKRQDAMDQAFAGDIVAVAKLKDTRTGDTLCDPKDAVLLEALPALRPVVTFAIRAKNKGEDDKVMGGLYRLIEEDPTLQLRQDEQSGDLLLSGMGQVHIEVVRERLKRKFGLEVELGLPTVPYRETVRKAATAEGKHKKQTGGRGQFGLCIVEISPRGRGEGYEYVDAVFGGSIPRQFIPAVDKGAQKAMEKGPLAGFPVVDVQLKCLDGKYHAVDSSEMAFTIAGSLGFRAAMEAADPVLLEPVMALEITVPSENMGDVYGDISSRRGRVLGSDTKGKLTVIRAEAPYAELLNYAPELTAMTSGRGEYTMEMVRYDEVPGQIAAKIIEKAQANKEG